MGEKIETLRYQQDRSEKKKMATRGRVGRSAESKRDEEYR